MCPSTKASNGMPEPVEGSFQPDLSRVEMAAVIDALLQAEITLPLIDARNLSIPHIERIRSLQLNLAHRLEDLLAEEIQARVATE